MGFQRVCVGGLAWLPRDGLGEEDGGGSNQSLKHSKRQHEIVKAPTAGCVCVCVRLQ